VTKIEGVFTAACIACGVLTVGAIVSTLSQTQIHSEDASIIVAAEYGVCQQVNYGACSEPAKSDWKKDLDIFEPSIVRSDDNHADVSFYFQGKVMAKARVARDEDRQWHAQ
jgi:hypothetical protein